MLPWNIGKIKCPNVAFRLIVSNVRKVNSVVSSLVTEGRSSRNIAKYIPIHQNQRC